MAVLYHLLAVTLKCPKSWYVDILIILWHGRSEDAFGLGGTLQRSTLCFGGRRWNARESVSRVELMIFLLRGAFGFGRCSTSYCAVMAVMYLSGSFAARSRKQGIWRTLSTRTKRKRCLLYPLLHHHASNSGLQCTHMYPQSTTAWKGIPKLRIILIIKSKAAGIPNLWPRTGNWATVASAESTVNVSYQHVAPWFFPSVLGLQ